MTLKERLEQAEIKRKEVQFNACIVERQAPIERSLYAGEIDTAEYRRQCAAMIALARVETQSRDR